MEITKERTSNDRKGTTSKKSKKGNTALMQSAVDTDSIENSNIFDVVEEMPSFPGGMAALMKYIKDNLRYPEICREGAAMGRVNVVFIVNEDGSLSDVKVIRNIIPELDKEAIRVVKSRRTRQTLWSAVQMLTQKLCCQTIHDCPKVVPLHYESE